MKISVAQLGARMHYAVPYIFYLNDRLDKLYTDIYVTEKVGIGLHLGLKISSSKRLSKLEGRRHEGLPDSKVRSFPVFGFRYLRDLSKCKTLTETIAVYIDYAKAFAQKVIKNWSDSSDCVYTYNTASLEIAQFLKSIGKQVVLEQTIAPFYIEQELLFDEYERFPEWAVNNRNPYSMNEVFEQYIQREREEHQLADLILCGSNFVWNSLPDGYNGKTITVPYGVGFSGENSGKKKDYSTPLNVLIVGAGLRKGTPYILEAAKQLRGKVNFRLLGTLQGLPDNISKELDQHMEWAGSVPRSQVNDHYQWADIMLFPSLCEGSATVIYEAIANGLPVVTTHNSGSLITDNKDGIIIPIRSAEHIVTALLSIMENKLLEEYKENISLLSPSISIQQYSERLISALNNLQ